MDNLYFGEIIRIRREELNMKQKELCEGVCERSTLSKIERGKNECSKYLAEVFLQRLGLPMDFYYASSSKTGIEQLKIKNKINDAIRMREYDKLPELIEIGNQVQDNNLLFKQFIVETEGIYALRVEKDIPKARELLLSAMRVLHEKFELDSEWKFRFITEEYYIMNILANTYVSEEKYDIAIEIFKKLLERAEKSFVHEDEESIRIIIMLMYNLSRSYGRTNHFVECLEISEKAIELCKRFGRTGRLAELLINKGYALCATFRKNEGILVLKNALAMCDVLGMKETINIIYKDAKELFGIDLPKII